MRWCWMDGLEHITPRLHTRRTVKTVLYEFMQRTFDSSLRAYIQFRDDEQATE